MSRLSFQHFTATVAVIALGGWAATNAVITSSLGRPHQAAADIPALGQQIHDYLVAHPEVITEAQQTANKRQAVERQAAFKQALAANRNAVYSDPADPVIGNPHGDVTIVEFYDPDCPFCRSLAPALFQLVAEDHGVRLIIKDYPILGPGSELASRYALASIKQGKYAEFHKALMASKLPEHELDQVKIEGFAAAAGLDIARLRGDAADPAITQKINANRELARTLTIVGTPGLIVADQLQGGAAPLEAIKKFVADARAMKVSGQ